MIIIALNIKGVWGPPKHRALCILVLSQRPSIIPFQETMVSADKAKDILINICPDWCIFTANVVGLSWGLSMIWNPREDSLQSFSSTSGIILEGALRCFDGQVIIVNCYGPYQDQDNFWNHIVQSGLFNA